MNSKTLTMLAVGDVILHGEPPAEPFFDLVAPVLRSADVVVGQLEIPLTSRPVITYVDLYFGSTRLADAGNISALSYSGFNVMHLAGNHIWDSGAPGIEDTIAGLRDSGIDYCGAGMNIDEARRPAVIERDGTRFGFLSYNCTGPIGSWATMNKPGCAYVHIITAYEQQWPVVGGYPTIYTFAEPDSLKAMVDDIQKLRPLCDVLVVHFHKGWGFVPVRLTMYDQQVSYAAIDAGADLVLGDHAHILKGIEHYKGKAIFHNLGDFVTRMGEFRGEPTRIDPWRQKLRATSDGGPFFFGPSGTKSVASERGGLEQRLSIIAKFVIDDGHISQLSYIPCLLDEKGKPEILKNDERGQKVFDYLNNITKGAGLNTRYEWKGDEVLIHEE
jgi:poly-gamma-glutamate capsule biosynthesis protein CapA/YwtB (metallophosphatase superfamily)